MNANEFKQLVESDVNVEFRNAMNGNSKISEIVTRIYNGNVYKGDDDDDEIYEDFPLYTNDDFEDDEKFSGEWMLDDCGDDGWATSDKYDDVDKLEFYYAEYNDGSDVRVQIVVDENDKIIMFGWSSD